jgi:nucleotide-binding universal stress UspA family protein
LTNIGRGSTFPDTACRSFGEFLMYRKVLIPTDGSKLAKKSVTDGIAFAKTIGASIVVLTVTAPFHIFTLDPQAVEDTPAQYKKRMQEHAARILETAAAAARAARVKCDTVHLEHEHPNRAIINTAKSKGCDLIVMASHGRRGMSALLLGSETVKVLTHSKIPVLVHR